MNFEPYHGCLCLNALLIFKLSFLKVDLLSSYKPLSHHNDYKEIPFISYPTSLNIFDILFKFTKMHLILDKAVKLASWKLKFILRVITTTCCGSNEWL